MIRILFIIDSLGSSGKERQLVEHIKGLNSVPSIHFKIVLLSKMVHYESILNMNGSIIHLERQFKKDPTILFKLHSICQEFRPDIISSWERMCSIYALPVAKWIGVKFINGVIRNAPDYLKKYNSRWIIEKLTFPFSDAIVANSKKGLKVYKVPSPKGYYVHNGFDFSRIEKINKSVNIKKLYQIKTPYVVGMVAGFNKRKDFQSFILAAVKIISKRNDVTFLAIGDGANVVGDLQKSTFEKSKILVDSDQRKRIIFPGRLKNIEEVIQILDIGVLLTNQNCHGEGISNSIMEYMALGKPVIATNGGGTPEIVVDGVTGFLVPNKDVKQTIAKIEFFLDNPQIAKSMGLAGKKHLKINFNLNKMTENYIKLYQNILNKTHP